MTIKRISLLLCLSVIFSLPLPRAISQSAQGCNACSLVQRALNDSQDLKVGMARKDIEAHNFVLAGGMTFRSRTTYMYKDCNYIQVEIEFDFDPAVDQDFSPKDVIKDISKLTIGYPAKD